MVLAPLAVKPTSRQHGRRSRSLPGAMQIALFEGHLGSLSNRICNPQNKAAVATKLYPEKSFPMI
jgi:hypothetical protein